MTDNKPYPHLPPPDFGRARRLGAAYFGDAFTADQMRAYADATCAMRAAEPAREYACPTKTVADLVNNLLLLDQSLSVYGAQYIEHEGRRRAIAVEPTVSRERVKGARWIGEGEDLNSAVIWTRAEQPAVAQAAPSDPLQEMVDLSQELGLYEELEKAAVAGPSDEEVEELVSEFASHVTVGENSKRVIYDYHVDELIRTVLARWSAVPTTQAAPQPAAPHVVQRPMPSLESAEVNEAAWWFVEAMPHSLPVPVFNDLKPALYAALTYFHAALAAQPQEAAPKAVPEGWVPCVIDYEGGHPEEVAFGPQIMMDRLKKWLTSYFAIISTHPAKGVPAQGDAEDAASLLALLADIRAASGDHGKRMQPELVKHIRELAEDAARLDWLQETSCDLRSIDMPTGAGDSDVHWIVVEHYMDEPREREIGRSFSDDPRAAIDAARAQQQGK